MTVTAQTDTLAANPRPRSTSVPRSPEPAPTPEGAENGADAQASAEQPEQSTRRRGRPRKPPEETSSPPEETPPKRASRRTAKTKTPTPAPPEPLTADELRDLGSLMVDAAALGQSVEDYVADLRAQLRAHDRLLEVTAYGA